MTSVDPILWGVVQNGYESGGTLTGTTTLELTENALGVTQSCPHLSGTHWHWGLGSTPPVQGNATTGLQQFNDLSDEMDILIADNRLPFVDWGPGGGTGVNNIYFRPSQVAAGFFDAYLDKWFQDAAAWGHPLMIRPMWENNGTWFIWGHGTSGSFTIPAGNNWGGVWTNTVADYKGAMQKICDKRTQNGATNIQICQCFNRRGASDVLTIADMYVADCDWIGWDSYPANAGDTLGEAGRGTGSLSFLADHYAECIALDPNKPIGLFETNHTPIGVGATTFAITSITPLTDAGTTWTIVVPAGSGAWAVGQGIGIYPASPAGYQAAGEITSVTGTGPYTLKIAKTTNPGTFSSGTGIFLDYTAAAATITQSLEIDVPAMPMIKGIWYYWRPFTSTLVEDWTTDNDRQTITNPAFLALKKALGGSKYLPKGLLTNVAARQFVPWHDQPLTTPGQERYIAVHKAAVGLEGLWINNDLAGPTADSSGNGRTGTVTGTPAFNQANVIAAEPSWGSIVFPGAAGNNISLGDLDVWSPAVNGQMTFILSYYTAGAPAATAAFFAKYANTQFEYWCGLTSAGHLNFVMHPLGGGTYANYDRVLGATAGIHWVAFVIDTTQSIPITGYVDGTGSPLQSGASSGVIGNGTTPLLIGQRGDATAPLPNTIRMGHLAIYSKALSVESLANNYAAFLAGPAISGIASAPVDRSSVVTFNTDVPGSTQIEYGLTSGYGSVTPYNRARQTAHSASILNLTPGTTYHYRPLSRNDAGTQTAAVDQTFTTAAAGTGTAFTTVIS